jgi:hypothetical protein
MTARIPVCSAALASESRWRYISFTVVVPDLRAVI